MSFNLQVVLYCYRMEEVTSSGCGYESAGVLSLDTDGSTTADDLDGKLDA